MRVYISGPIDGERYRNARAFGDAVTRIRASGHEPFSPLETGVPDTAPRAQHMRADLSVLLTCHAVVLLDGWQRSPGARLEVEVALQCGLIVYPPGLGPPPEASP